MKKLVVFLALLLLPLAALSAQELMKEWVDYAALVRKDRPRERIEKLHQIRSMALARRLPEDLLKACQEEKRASSRLNWKAADSLQRALTRVVESYGEPLLTYRWLEQDWAYAKDHQKKLGRTRHPELQTHQIPFLQTRDVDDIADDFEWILWDRLTKMPSLGPDSEEFHLLDGRIGNRYPNRPYLSYLMARRAEDPLPALQALAEKYADTPFRFIPEQEILQERWKRLRNDATAVEADFKELYEDVVAFQKAVRAQKSGFSRGKDLSVENIRDGLTASRLTVEFQQDYIILTGRNFGRGVVSFESDDCHRTVSVRNRDGRFYVPDTVKAPIPVLPDGSYNVVTQYGGHTVYQKHTLSLAVRQQGEGFAIYVADYLTGEPLSTAVIRLEYGRNNKRVLEREIRLSDQGFTVLPAEFQEKVSDGRSASLEVRSGDRRSRSVSLREPQPLKGKIPATLHARVFKDRGAYRPGDTLKAKAVLFEGDLRDRVKALGKGKSVQVKIFDTRRNKLADMNLKTNAFGSVAWEWAIPEGERNGLWNIEVVYKDELLARSAFRVDDFVLPTFEVTFDPQEKPFFPDTETEVCGKVTSYSGHPVDKMKLEGRLTRYSREVWKGAVSVDADGAFRIPLTLDMGGEYELTVRAIDATGETHDFKRVLWASPNLSLSVELENAIPGALSVGLFLNQDKSVLTEPVAHFTWAVKNGREAIHQPVRYFLKDADGNEVRSGTSEETLELDLSDCPDGLYYLQGTATVSSRSVEVEMPILKMTSGLNAPVRSVFLAGETEIEAGERIQVRLGAGAGPVWAVATLAAPDGSVLESRPLHLYGDESLLDLPFVYKDAYPDAVQLEIFYFRDAVQVTHVATYRRVRHSLDLPLAFGRFEDRTRPGAPVTLSLQSVPGAEAVVSVYDKSLDAVAPNVWKRVEPAAPTFRKLWSQRLAGRISGQPLFATTGIAHGEGTYGFVVDIENEPILGASVGVEGTATGTVTDLEGHFSLSVPFGTSLEIACIGYETVHVTAGPGMVVVLEEDTEMLEETVVIGYGVASGSSSEYEPRRPDVVVRADAYVDDMPELSDEDFRAVFSEALAFEPFVYPDKDGKLDVTFRTSDKLSTYHVNVFAHDLDLRNATLQRDFVVTVPVQISVAAPRYLYEEDRYLLSASVSNSSQDTLSGRLYLRVEMEDAVEDRQPTYAQAADLTVPAGGSSTAQFTVTAPPSFQPSFVGWWDEPELNLQLVFEGDGFSDAVRLSVPVERAEQLITECHSALAGPEAVDSLRRMFVNAPGDKAEVTYRTLREAAEAGLEQWTAPEDPDALSLSAAFYARALLGRDTTGTLAPLLALRCEDGGFAWTQGMESSAVVTATILERMAVLRDKGIAIPDMTQTVHYLDYSQFGNWWPFWCGGLSDDQYMDIRAMWASVPFDLKGVEEKAVRRYRLQDFRSFARKYLTPGRYDYTNGWILDKARRVRTLRNLTASEAGLALGRAWGEVVFASTRFENTIQRDLASLEQYAVRHPSGGLYYPNAVLPFRGLLSSEVYAHTLLAGLLEGRVSDGVRLWLALQNETQSWTGDPAYVDALQLILSSPASLLDRQIVTLTASDTLPFADIQASGSDMRITRRFCLEQDYKRYELHPGDTLQVGDKVVAEYMLWSAENRSFVRLDAFREACFLPVDQLSGQVSGDGCPVRVDGVWTRRVQCYRDVRADRTCWWLDVCPEETTRWEESFFVTQAGTFAAPVVTVESLYAPQYRANAAYGTPLTARP